MVHPSYPALPSCDLSFPLLCALSPVPVGQTSVSTRDQVMANRQTLNNTSDRLVQIERLGEQSKTTGEQIMTDLDDQRDTLVRVGHKVQPL